MTQSGFARSLGVIIGIDRYTNGIPPLATAGSDARSVAELLRDQHGYDLCLLVDEDASLARLTTLLKQELPAQIGPEDRVFFYFAGHGVALDGEDGPEGFILPQDAQRDSADSFLAMPDLHDALCALQCRHLLAVLDCCFAGAFRWSSTRDVVPLPSVLHRERYDRFIESAAWQVISSAAHDEKAMDVLFGRVLGSRGGEGAHSPFAELLLKGLSGAGDVVPAGGGDGVITATELYVYLDDALARQVSSQDHRQTPCLWPLKRHDKGQYIFLTPGHALDLPPAPALTRDNNPYRGLEPFGEEHQALFFGRDRVIRSLTAHAAKSRFTVVVGASGTGKSSLVKAGLVPALRAQGWDILPIVRPGASPLKSLAAALTAPTAAAGMTATLSPTPSAAIARWLAEPPARPLLLVIDQMEELVTMCREEQERDEFVRVLVDAITAHQDLLKVVLTVRSDFEPQLARGPVEALWPAARFVVPPMTQDELRDAIEKPASERVLYFEPPSLVDELINEVVQMPGALPLLSFTLSELYVGYLDHQDGNRALTRAHYEALGGVIGALRHRATEEYEQLDPAHRATLRRVVLRMVSLEGGDVARRRVPIAELVYADHAENQRVERVIDRLTSARLVVRGLEEGTPYVEPAHDELVRGWDRLWDWIRAERRREDDLVFQRRVTQSSREWEAAAQSRSAADLLWQDGFRSKLLKRVLESSDPWPNELETRFSRQSIGRRRRNLRNLILSITAIVATAVLAIVFAVAAQRNQRQAEAQTRRALSRQLGARVDRFLLDGQYDLALLTAVEANNSEQTYEARNALLTALQQSPRAMLRDPDDTRDAPTAIALSPDGQSVAAAYDSILSLWKRTGGSWTAGVARTPLEGDTGRLSALEFRRDAGTLAGLHQDGRLELWDVGTGRRVTDSVNTQSGDASNLSGDTLAVAISRDGKCEVALWSVSSGNRLDSRQVSLEGKPIAVGPKGKTVVVADTNGTVILWDVARDHEIARPLPASVEEIRLDPEAPEASRKRDVLARFSPDGRRLAVGLNEGAFPARGSVTVWNVDRGAQLGNALVQPGGVESLAFTEDGQTLAVSGRTVMLWDIGPRRQGTHVLSALGDGGPSIAWSPDDRRLASGGDSGKVVLWDARSGQKLKEIVTGLKEQVLGIQFADDTILRVGDASGAIILWNLERGRRKGPPGGRPGEVDTLRFSPDGKLAISTRGSGTSVWGLAQGRELMRLPPALTSPDGRAVLWSVEDNDQVVVWDAVGDRRWQFTLPKEGLLLAAFALSPDENSLAIAGGIGQGRTWIWDLAHRRISGNALATTFGALGSNIAFSPDGKTLASSGATGPDSAGLLHDVISLWDVNTRQRLGQPLEAGVGSVNQLAWSHDGRRLASTGFLFTTPGGVAVWDASVESWQELACQVAGRNLSADEWAMAMPGLPYHQTCPGLPVMDYYTPRPPPNEADTSASPENRTPLSP